MEDAHSIRELVLEGKATPALVRDALNSIAPRARDAWVDRLLGLEEIPDDGPALPRGAVPYLPCAIDSVLRAIDLAGVTDTDLFVDVGSGVGRVTTIVHLLTGASTLGLEIQPQLVQAAHALSSRLGLSRVKTLEGDAHPGEGTVFFLYCPFSGDRLNTFLDELERLRRPVRLCCVDLPIPARPWLSLLAEDQDVTVFTSAP
ncbi:MAG: hypothetical protein GQE15_18750 [Archangiaceae bacterium]|nr:hypothetical protein [Archangiaceae bacterium]